MLKYNKILVKMIMSLEGGKVITGSTVLSK
jgi:hypothetical protein